LLKNCASYKKAQFLEEREVLGERNLQRISRYPGSALLIMHALDLVRHNVVITILATSLRVIKTKPLQVLLFLCLLNLQENFHFMFDYFVMV